MKRQEMPRHIVILAGGMSSRMGEDKALLTVAGTPMLQRIVTTALSVRPAMQVTIVGRDRPDTWPADLGVRFMPDDVPHVPEKTRSAGPLAGLITALANLNAPLLLLPCDTPLISAMLLEKLLAAHIARPPGTTATISLRLTFPPEPEPTLAVYTPALLPTLQQMLRDNRRALHPLIALPGVETFDIPTEHLSEMVNINTPADLAHAEAVLSQRTAH